MFIAIVGGLFVGLLMGALGGGGAILAIPLLTFGLGMPVHDAAVASLVIVGLGALSGVSTHARYKHVWFQEGILFGVFGIGGAFLGTLMAKGIDSALLLSLFSILLVVVAGSMIRKALKPSTKPPTLNRLFARVDGKLVINFRGVIYLVITATIVGFLTGFFGVGGGFAIVPALMLVFGLPMPVAVGTSLLVIFLNSVTAFILHGEAAMHLDWVVVSVFTLLAMSGSVVGGKLAHRIPKKVLQLSFASLLIVISIYTAIQSVPQLLS